MTTDTTVLRKCTSEPAKAPSDTDAPAQIWYPDFVNALPRMDGKIVAVTGCTTGTGLTFAKTVAKLGATIIMLNRPSVRAEAALADVKAYAPNAVVLSYPCDLLSFESVKSAAAAVAAACPGGLDVLCNNAGIMGTSNVATVDGFNQEMQANHLSHFLLTSLLWPLLERAAEARGEARVVNHSSSARKIPFAIAPFSGHMGVKPKFYRADISKLGGDWIYGRFSRYGQTKLANSVFTHALATKQSKVKALVAHPGVCQSSLLQGTLSSGSVGPWLRRLMAYFEGVRQSQEDGTLGILSAACLPEASTGQLWGPAKDATAGPAVPSPVVNDFWFDRSLRYATDTLWEESLKATGAKFPF